DIHVLRYGIGGWEEAFAPLHVTPAKPAYFKLLNFLGRPAVWVLWGAPDDTLGKVWTGPDQVIKFDLPPLTATSPPTPRRAAVDLTVSGDQLYLFFLRKDSDNKEKLYQQVYSSSGQARQG